MSKKYNMEGLWQDVKELKHAMKSGPKDLRPVFKRWNMRSWKAWREAKK